MGELGSVNFSQSNEDVLENALDYVEFFSTYVDHLPPLLQRRISRLKEIDATTYKLCEEAEKLYQQILADRHSKKNQASRQKYKLINKLRETLTLCQQLGDEKMDIAENIETTIDQKAEVLNKKREEFMSSYNPQWKEELANKKKENSKSDHRPKRPKRTARNMEKHLDKDKSHTNGSSFRLYVNNKHDSAASTSKTHNSGELETSSSSYSHHWGKYHQSDEPPSKREKLSLSSSSTVDHGKKATSSSSPADNSSSNSAALYSSAKPTASQSTTSSSRSNNNNSTASATNSKSSSSKLNNSTSRSSSSAVKESGGKRKRKDNKRKQKTTSYSGGASSPQNDVAIDPNEPLYCICKQVSYGSMVCCDNKKCPYQWFHFSCVGLTSKPKRQKWYCSECLKDRRNSRNNDK